ncbi:MAG: IPT/TIG domain-containing protein, partial [Sphaerochaetaceae bacterium]|nr:IPT/TIG domain-containing protein [Sphaerochaetaceae bacterium]
MRKHISRHLLSFLLLSAGLLLARLAFAQDFGTEAVSNGLSNSLATGDPRTIAGRVINIALGFLSVIVVGLMLYGGFIWMTANGQEEKVEQAKKIIRNAVIGLIIILASWAIATFAISRLSGAVNGGGDPYGCTDGSVSACGCGGSMYCVDGSWGACIGSNCGSGEEVSCDADLFTPTCDALDQKCDPTYYCDSSDCKCHPNGEFGDPCDADISTPQCNPSNNRCSDYLTCNPENCTCFGPPVITGVSPVGGFCEDEPNKICDTDADCSGVCNKIAPNGAPNNFITIFGKNFGSYSATSSRVVFLGSGSPRDGRQPAELNPACLNSWGDKQIIIAVPTGVSNGPIKVINSDLLEDATDDGYGPQIPDFVVNNIVAPGLCDLSPNRGLLNSSVSYQGINLYTSEAYFGNYYSNVKALSSDFINPIGLSGTSTTPNIQPGDSGSFVENNLGGNRVKSNYLLFTKESEPNSGPFISSFSPASGTAGQYITILGKGFGGARGISKVYFGDTEAVYEFPDVCLNSVWKDGQIIVKVPPGLTDGSYIISINLGDTVLDTQKLNPNSFIYNKNLALKTSLCKIYPDRGPIATPVDVWGEYFGNVDGQGIVRFNYNKNATGTIEIEGGAQKIRTLVPTGAITGPVRIIKNGEYGNELNFSVGECVIDSDCGAQICCPTNTFKQGRCADNLEACSIDIPTSVFEWSFNTGYGNSTTTPFYSCAGLAKFYGACQTGKNCPNVPGTCSPYDGGSTRIVADCDYSCDSVAGCNVFGANCYYDANSDACILGGNTRCDLSQELTLPLSGGEITVTQVCNDEQHWEISTVTSCPEGWTRTIGNKCINESSTCLLCPEDLSCSE